MNEEFNRKQAFHGEYGSANQLWKYVQSLSQETVDKLSKPQSAEVFQVMEHNLMGLLGTLPSEHFDINISTDRENLGRLLASAMMSGYFLRNAEQRMAFEKSLGLSGGSNSEIG